ncbi:HigA family addiction module antitoxin [Butyrivibrio proteoclasticus]|uniref:HigA family addiction module antitoxin n=1 Tax=Butyrivibrio proteoclasticus TaxID=43305 RepID=UPI000686CE97|nr:HigA family addiction module antitoxin [Butyrivibrio proteoclasticus]
MTKTIETPTAGEILREEFMDPYGISAYKLAKDIKVPTSRVQEILNGRRKITVDTSLRLAKYFGVSDKYFLDIQDEIDIRNAKIELRVEMDSIKQCEYVITMDTNASSGKRAKKELVSVD